MVAEALKEAPPDMPRRLLFQDEGRFGRINDPRRCWMPLPQRPVVRQQVVREYLYSFVAVCPFDGQFSCLTLPWADTTAMSIFLEHTAGAFPGEFCLMFLDGAGWHQARDLRVPPTIRLLPLPPYSPELNPVEHIWDHLRENDFRNEALESLNAVADRLGQGLRRLAFDPPLVKSLTCFDWINTIRMTAN